ncbi:hypothetical protein BH09SUM1_BH09SUM1_01430 [soil metagenome]
MEMARIIGTVVATQRDPLFTHLRLAIVQVVDEKMASVGEPIVAIDALNRRRGDLVFLVRSGDAVYGHYGDQIVPTDCAIGGLIDQFHIAGIKG